MNATTERVLALFEQVSAIPRCSRNEAGIRQWLVGWAAERGYATRGDAVGNLVIAAPARGTRADLPPIIIQGHLDMVCEKTPESPHDFTRDPITLVRDGEWLRADRTTLGADNGIAIAMALALLTDDDAVHPALELLFTVDEETGLTGATELDPEILRGHILLNVDSEDEGVLTVGCAGGQQTDIAFALDREPTPAEHAGAEVHVRGVSGGHSGVDIHTGRANANVLLARALRLVTASHAGRIATIHGGTAHNAIARDAVAVVALPAAGITAAREALAELTEILRREYATTDPNLTVELVASAVPNAVWTANGGQRAVGLLVALPHGVARMSPDIAGLVQTSNNLATLRTDASGVLRVVTSQRSSVMSELYALSDRVALIAGLAGADASTDAGYPAWEPDMASPLLARCREVHVRELGAEPVVEIIHAGLECGVIGAKRPGMDMISFGPTIKDPHSPNERLHLPSVEPVYRYMKAILASFAEG